MISTLAAARRPGTALPLLTFIALGLPAGALGVAWPGIRSTFATPLAGLGILLGLGSLASLLTTIFTGVLNQRLGANGLVIAACAGSALTLAAMAASPDFRLLIAAWVLSAALTGPLDAALNANLALHRGIRLMGWLHASWALGAAFGPAIVGAALLAFGSWRPAFGAIALTWALLGLATARWRPYQKVGAADAPSPAPSTRGGRRELATHLPRPVVIAALLFFFNFGFEISGGQWPFTQLTAGRGLAPLIAGWGAALYWLALTAGRVLLGLAGHRFESSTLLNASSLLAIAGSLAFWLLPAPAAAIVALPALGLGSSVVVPVVYKLLPQRIPSKTATRATGYVAAVGLIGGALIPPAIGLAFQLSGPWVLGPALLSLAVAFGLLQRALAGLRQPGD